MLIIPYQTRFTAKSLPWVTLALVAINLLVYVVLQAGDNKAYERAADYYFSVQLPQVELPRYAAHLERRGDRRAMQVLSVIRSGPSPDEARAVLMVMQRDRAFMNDMKAGRVVRTDEPAYAAWREQRDRFQDLMSQVFVERFALEPGSADLVRLFTYQFLHGDAVHLLGNMAILLLAGPFAEAALGRWRFLLAYLASGALAGAVHLLVSSQGLIGASGSIAGTMAMVAVLYGKRKVPVFYWLFVYFNTARLPALLLLPVWIALEAVQWALSPGDRVAYDVHLAGFIAGAAIAWLLKPADAGKVDRILDEQYAAAPAERKSTLLTEARQAAAKLDTRRAAAAYGELLQDDPTNTQYATAYFNMALLGRDKDTLADAALRALWIRTRHARTELRPIYTQMSQPHVLSVLPVDEQLRLARRLVATREDACGVARARRLAGRQHDAQPVWPPAGRLPARALHDVLAPRLAPAGGPGQAATVAALSVARNARRHRSQPRTAAHRPRRHHARPAPARQPRDRARVGPRTGSRHAHAHEVGRSVRRIAPRVRALDRSSCTRALWARTCTRRGTRTACALNIDQSAALRSGRALRRPLNSSTLSLSLSPSEREVGTPPCTLLAWRGGKGNPGTARCVAGWSARGCTSAERAAAPERSRLICSSAEGARAIGAADRVHPRRLLHSFHHFEVAPRLRGHGVGRVLLQQIVEYAASFVRLAGGLGHQLRADEIDLRHIRVVGILLVEAADQRCGERRPALLQGGASQRRDRLGLARRPVGAPSECLFDEIERLAPVL